MVIGVWPYELWPMTSYSCRGAIEEDVVAVKAAFKSSVISLNMAPTSAISFLKCKLHGLFGGWGDRARSWYAARGGGGWGRKR